MSSGVPDAHAEVKPGLDAVDALKPHQGWVAADLQAATDVPLKAKVEAGYKFNDELAGYGDVWVQPTLGKAGADAGLRISSSVDLFAGVSGDTHGDVGFDVGVKWVF